MFHIAVSAISEQYATARASGDKRPSQEHPMYNGEQPESARASQDGTSSQEYPAENQSKFVITCSLSVKAQYLCAVSYMMPWVSYRANITSHLSHLSTTSSPLTVIIGQILLSSVFTPFTFQKLYFPKDQHVCPPPAKEHTL